MLSARGIDFEAIITYSTFKSGINFNVIWICAFLFDWKCQQICCELIWMEKHARKWTFFLHKRNALYI